MPAGARDYQPLSAQTLAAKNLLSGIKAKTDS